MQLFTSNFARLKRIVAPCRPVSIAVGPPRWYRGEAELRLAPTRDMLEMSPEDYDRHYDAILATLDPADVARTLGDGAVMLCWESPNVRCHRRRVAEWLEAALGIEVPEYGFARVESRPYSQMPAKSSR